MATKKCISPGTCNLTLEEYDNVTLELARIDYLAKMGSDSSDDPGAVECATSLIQERSDNISELLSRAFDRAKAGVAHG